MEQAEQRRYEINYLSSFTRDASLVSLSIPGEISAISILALRKAAKDSKKLILALPNALRDLSGYRKLIFHSIYK